MASLSFVVFAVVLLAATSSAAPRSNKLGINIPSECKNKEGFCSVRPEGYDEIEEKINKLLPPYLVDLADRNSDGTATVTVERDEDNCPSEMRTTKVFTHQDNKTKVDIIVNTKLFPQSLVTIHCLHNNPERYVDVRDDNKQCFRALGLSRGDYNMNFRCLQSTATRTLLIYDPDVEILKTKAYTIPVCCSCHITSDI